MLKLIYILFAMKKHNENKDSSSDCILRRQVRPN